MSDAGALPAEDEAGPGQSPARQPKIVVGVGASAGGLEALEAMFDHVTESSGAAFIVVTHLSPDFKSLLDELIARHTAMPVKVVDDGVALRTNTIFVIPPNKDMIIAGGRLVLSDRDMSEHYTRSIDIFLRSLARECGPNAVGVILSGTGSDGARGLKAIKEAGGLTIVQNPRSAKFDGMPKSAIDTGTADHVVEACQIGQIVETLAHDRRAEAELSPDADGPGRQGDVIQRIFTTLYQTAQVDFAHYKSNMVMRRTARRAQLAGYDRIEDYAKALEQDTDEVLHLSRDLLISVTEFFRDAEAFAALRSQVIDPLVQEVGSSRPLRVWSPGCSSGEEAFSIAMVIHDAGVRAQVNVTAQIFATDIHRSALDAATRGTFRGSQLQAVPAAFRSRYFEEAGEDEYRINPALRKWLVFAQHNLLTDPPFTKIDLVSCRNMLIYLDSPAQSRALSLLHFSLNHGGYLFLGPSENLGALADEFETLNGRWRLFRRQAVRHSARAPDGVFGSGQRRTGQDRPPPLRVAVAKPRRDQSLVPAYVALLEAFVPAGALINSERELLHTFGDTAALLHPPKGAMSPDILRMVDEALRVPLATGIERAMRECGPVVFPHVRLAAAAPDRTVTLTVTPLRAAADKLVRYFFVAFQERQDAAGPAHDLPQVVDLNELTVQRIVSLEEELRQTRENLHATIEEVETSNEELQSANEELMASNEELQSTNEELQSVNEELYTVNAEYQKQNVELSSLNRDVENLLRSTEIGVIFVDDQSVVRRFTAAATQIVNLIPEDVGRSLSDITTKLSGLDLSALVRRALETRETIVVDRASDEGTWWRIRCLPYRAEKDEMDGAVLTVFSINDIKQIEIALRERTHYHQTIADLTNAFSLKLDPRGRSIEASASWQRYTGQSDADRLGLGWLDAVLDRDRERVKEGWDVAIVEGHEFPLFFRLWHAASGTHRHVAQRGQPLMSDRGGLESWFAVFVDIEDAIQAEDTIRESEEILRTVMRSSPSQMAYVDAEEVYHYANDACERMLQLPPAEIVGRRVADLMPPEIYAQSKPHIAAALRGERVRFSFCATAPDGSQVNCESVFEPDFDANGIVRGFAVSTLDLSDAHAFGQAQAGFEATLTRLVDVASIGIVLADGDSLAIQQANRAACHWSGYGVGELTQRALTDLLPELPAARLKKAAAQRQHDAPGQPLRTYLLQRHGGTMDVDLSLHDVPGEQQHRIAAVLVDVSHHAATEQSLRQRASELSRASYNMESFAAAASHDLKEPIRKIDRFVAMLEEDFGEQLGEHGRGTIRTVRSAAERMRALIEALLDLYRIKVDTSTFRPVPLTTVVETVIIDLDEAVAHAQATIRVKGLPVVIGDQRLLSVLFCNLLTNALRYRSADRALVIDVVAGQPDGGMSEVVVADNGIGFDPRYGEEIFLPLRRLTSRAEVEGSGMGLAICKRIVESHGGGISATGTPGQGAMFRVRLPSPPRAADVG